MAGATNSVYSFNNAAPSQAGSYTVVVTNVGGYAQSVGLRPGDLVKALNGRRIGTTAELQSAVGASGGSWRITVNRRGRDITASFQL